MAQLMPGQQLITVNGISVKRQTYAQCIELLRVSTGRPLDLEFAGVKLAAGSGVESGAPGTSASPRGSGSARKRREIEALYGANNPEKLADVDTLLEKYGVDRLLAMVRKKYGVPPPRKQIEAYYARHNPQKLPEVDGLLAKYGEERLLAMVKKKYASPASLGIS